MEIIIVIIIILAYGLILTANLNYILVAGVIVVGLFLGFLTLFFGYCTICLLCSKKKEASFVRMGQLGSSEYQVAYYLVEGKEYPCIFPKEGILEDKLYQRDKTYYVMLNKKMDKVYDRFALVTCLLGLVCSVLLSMVMVAMYC